MDESYRHCEALVRAADKDRFLATLFAPADKRAHLLALYAFDIEITSVRDRAHQPMPGEIRLRWWRDVLNDERGNEAAANPLAATLMETITRFNLPVAPLLELIEAHAFDLYDDPMPTLAALDGYAGKTEVVVIEQAAQILAGSNTDVLTSATEHAGIAATIANSLRSFARHASRRQVFVPLELLDRHDARLDEIYAGRATSALLAALTELRSEARRHLASFKALLPQLPAAAMPAFLTIALVPAYLSAMDRSDYDPFRSPVEVAQWRRQWTLWQAARRYSRAMQG